jgi:hypothetical protein
MSNLELWDKVRRVPTEHLKGFKRAGGFSGTAIKPMWTVQTMTEQFGPCGQGWGIDAPSFQTVAGDNKETLVYCTVSVWHGSPEKKIFGVGGDRVVTHIKANDKYNTPERWQNDDEAFKKAFTDAVGNALKFLGVGADIHMGLWDGNKYVDEAPADKPAPMPKAEARPEYKKISDGIRQIRDTGNIEDLRAWYKSHVKIMQTFDQGWADEISKEFDEAKATLTAKAA